MPTSGAVHATGHAGSGGKAVVAVADAQGLAVSWGSVSLGRLVGVTVRSPSVQFEDVTNLSAAVVAYTNPDGSTSHHGVVKQLIASDKTPGAISIEWIGASGLSWSMIGHSKTLQITHAGGALGVSAVPAVLASFSINGAVGELVRGSAEFQLGGV